MKGYSKGFRGSVIGIVAAVFATGCLLIPTTLDLRLAWEMPWRLGSDQRIAVAGLHVLLGFAAAAVLGALWSIHMRAGWRQRRNHRNGAALTALLLTLALSGVGIFYLAEETAMLAVSLMHVVLGAVLPGLFVYHIVAGRRLIQQRRRPHADDAAHPAHTPHITLVPNREKQRRRMH